jgi:hypothetical protein
MILFQIGKKKKKEFKKLSFVFIFRSSECNISVFSTVPRRTSIRSLYNAEKYSGIKCALPSFTPTIPTTFKGLEKHYTPMKNQQSNISSSPIVCSICVLNFM